MTFDPTALPNSSGTLTVHWAARLEAFNDDDAVGTVAAQSGTSLTAVQASAGAKPTFKTNIMNGQSVFRFDGGDYLTSGIASDYKFMHDGTDYSVFIVFATTANDPDALFVLLDANGITSANIGASIFLDDRVSVPAEQRFRYLIGKGSSGFPIIDMGTENGGFVSASEMNLGSVIYDNGAAGDDAKVYAGGAFVRSQETQNTPHSAADPTNVFHIGTRASNQTLNLVGDIAEVLIFTGALDETDRKYIENELLLLYSRVLPTGYTKLEPGIKVTDGIGISMYSEDNQLIFIGRAADVHAFDNSGDVVMWDSPNGGGSWNNTTLFTQASRDLRNFGGGKVPSTNTLVYGHLSYDTASSAYDSIQAVRSIDNGASWNNVGEMPTGSATVYSPFGKLIELPSGSIGIPGLRKDVTNACATITYSNDDGLTWDASQLIISAAIATSEITETTVATIPGATDSVTSLIAIARNNAAGLHQFTSVDGGNTWSISGSLTFSQGVGLDVSPDLENDVDGTIYLTYADRGASKIKVAWGAASDIVLDHTAWNGPNIVYASNYTAQQTFGYPTMLSAPSYRGQKHIMFHDTAGSGTEDQRIFFSTLSAVSTKRRLI